MCPNHTPLEILFEDPFLVIINKPAGIHSVELPNSDQKNSIAHQLSQYDPTFLEASPKVGEAGLVNRLDFETSGIMLAAKNIGFWHIIFEQLKRGELQKSYLCLLEGELDHPQAIDTWIYSRYRHSKKVLVKAITEKRPERALPAESFFEKINYLSKADVTLARVHAHSARRHQIRAHAGYIGHPLCGDENYGSRYSLASSLKELGVTTTNIPSFALHAHTLEFYHPGVGELMKFEAPFNLQIYQGLA